MKRLILIATAAAALATALPVGQLATAREQEHGQDTTREQGRRDGGSREAGRRSLRSDEAPNPARDARRGGYLPDSFRGGVIEDYQRFRLRPPPRGYAWVRVNGGFALVSVGDGRIFDVIPD